MNKMDPALLEKLRRLDSCSVANAIETFDVRLRNTGFTDSALHCIFPDFPPMVGYAATVRVRTSDPPMEGDEYYYRLDWLDHVLSIPAPRVIVLQDMDRDPGARRLYRRRPRQHSHCFRMHRRGDEWGRAERERGKGTPISNVLRQSIRLPCFCPRLRFWDARGSRSHAGSAGRLASWRSPWRPNYPP